MLCHISMLNGKSFSKPKRHSIPLHGKRRLARSIRSYRWVECKDCYQKNREMNLIRTLDFHCLWLFPPPIRDSRSHLFLVLSFWWRIPCLDFTIYWFSLCFFKSYGRGHNISFSCFYSAVISLRARNIFQNVFNLFRFSRLSNYILRNCLLI